MKFKYSLTVGLFASVLVLGSCNDKKQANNKPKTKTKKETDEKVFDMMGNPVTPKPVKPAVPVTPAPVTPAEKPAPETPAPAPKKETLGPEIPANYARNEEKLQQGSVEDLAKKSGYAAFLPKDTEILLSLQGVDKMIAKFMTSDLRKAIDLFAPEGRSIELEMKVDREFKEFMSVAGEEVFFAAGNDSADFLKNVIDCYTVMSTYQLKGSLKTMLSFVNDDFEPGNEQERFMEFFKSEDGMIKYLKKMKASPLYAGFKVSDKEQREKFLKMLTEGSQQIVKLQPEGSKAFTTVKSDKGNGFTGVHINIAEAMKLMSPRDEKNFKEMLGESYDLLKAEAAKKEFTYMVGSVGDYIVFYAGANADGLEIAAKPSESVLANPEMSFATHYADKDVSFLGYISKEVSDAFMEVSGGYGEIFKALSEVLAETDTFGDTREFCDLLNKFGEKEKALYALNESTRYGMVGYFEDGYKFDTYMGKTSAYADLDSNRKLAAMANHKDAVISSNWISNSKAGAVQLDYLESLFVILYKGTKVATDFEADDEGWLEFTTTFRMFDAEFSGDLLRIWNGLKNGCAGLGNETAFMADLKGRLPRIPNAPSVVLDNGLFPRFAIAKHVTDRKKLSVAWDDISAAAKDIAGGISKITRKDIQLPKPERLKKGGLDIWSYQLGITTSEANLALGLNDKIFFLTTSPNYIAVRADELETKQAVKGAEFVIRVAPMRAAAEKWFALIEKNGEDFMSEFEWNDFKENKTKIKALIEATKQMEKIDIYTRKVDGEIRNTIHFDTNK